MLAVAAPPSSKPRRAPIAPWRGVVLACALAAGTFACGRPAEEPRLAPLHRLVARQEPPPPDATLEPGRYVTIDEIARPTLAAARPFRVAPECAPARGFAPGRCTVRVPPELAAAPALLVEIAHAPGRDAPDGRTERLVVSRPPSGQVGLPDGLIARTIRKVELRALPALAARAVTTAPLAIPAGARLRFAIGIEEPALDVASPAVELAVAALGDDGAAQQLFQRTLDPASVAGDRRWVEQDVALDALAGRTVRLRFSARPRNASDPRTTLSVWGDPTIWAPAADDPRPSIVLLSLDTLRAKSTSAYGYALDTTPYLTALARRGVLFERAFTTFSNTLGSHMSMLTGLYPATHGVVALDRPLGDAHATLAEVLRGAGYDTAAYTEDGLLEGDLGFQRGFASYAANKGVFSAAGDAPGTFQRALDWARGRSRTPFFLFVHTYAVHLPYQPPAAYARLFEEGVPGEQRAPIERERLHYEQEIRALDDEVEKLVIGLAALIPDERLLLIVTADHGEEFGEHGQVTHLQLYDEVMHVPLIVRLPGAVAAGRRVAAPVSLIDVAPTIVELAGARLPSSEGVSLVPPLLERDARLDRPAVFAQSLPYDVTGKQWRFIARAADTKCILPEQGPGACFDLTTDAAELQPLEPGGRQDLSVLQQAAAGYRRRALASIGAPGAQPIADGARAADPATQRKLRALGYAE